MKAPPPKFTKKTSEEEKKEEKKEEVKEVKGENAFSTVAFGGVRVNRKGGRGGRPGPRDTKSPA